MGLHRQWQSYARICPPGLRVSLSGGGVVASPLIVDWCLICSPGRVTVKDAGNITTQHDGYVGVWDNARPDGGVPKVQSPVTGC